MAQFQQFSENGPTTMVRQGAVGPAGVVNVRGEPVVPEEVNRSLQAISRRLRIEYLPAAWGLSAFVLKERWPDGDPRWREVQEGRYPEDKAFDVIERFPPDCRTGEMVAYIRNRWGDRAITDPKAEADALVARAEKLYAEANERAVNTMVEKGTQRILDESDHLRLVQAGVERAHPMVPGADFSDAPKRLL